MRSIFRSPIGRASTPGKAWRQFELALVIGGKMNSERRDKLTFQLLLWSPNQVSQQDTDTFSCQFLNDAL